MHPNLYRGRRRLSSARVNPIYKVYGLCIYVSICIYDAYIQFNVHPDPYRRRGRPVWYVCIRMYMHIWRVMYIYGVWYIYVRIYMCIYDAYTQFDMHPNLHRARKRLSLAKTATQRASGGRKTTWRRYAFSKMFNIWIQIDICVFFFKYVCGYGCM